MNKPESDESKDIRQAETLIKERTLYGVRPKRVAGTINQVVTRRGIAQQQTSNELRTAWDNIVGPKWNQLSLAARVSRGKLEVIVANSLVNQQLTFEKTKLLKKIQQALPDSKITSIRFSVGNVNQS